MKIQARDAWARLQRSPTSFRGGVIFHSLSDVSDFILVLEYEWFGVGDCQGAKVLILLSLRNHTSLGKI